MSQIGEFVGINVINDRDYSRVVFRRRGSADDLPEDIRHAPYFVLLLTHAEVKQARTIPEAVRLFGEGRAITWHPSEREAIAYSFLHPEEYLLER